jgi:hypothetical protein
MDHHRHLDIQPMGDQIVSPRAKPLPSLRRTQAFWDIPAGAFPPQLFAQLLKGCAKKLTDV